MKYRFALDIGIASVGWAVVSDDYKVVEAGSNLFESADASRNVERRGFRQLRRIHRRHRTRVLDFMKLWEKYFGACPDFIDAYLLENRCKGLREELTSEELFAVLRNFLLHRGISYLDDAIDDDANSSSSYQKGIDINRRELAELQYPCKIQKKRLDLYGQYRGNTEVEMNGEKVVLSNVFTTGAYQKEIEKILSVQKEFNKSISQQFIDEYIQIFRRKREYYHGPGNEKSRTDYGRYTTHKNPEGSFITEENIFEKLIGKCSVYTDELRAAGTSYTAQEFNILEDLNNITAAGMHLDEKQKREIIEKVKGSSRVDMMKLIAATANCSKDEIKGFRVDKSEKPIFHTFEAYRKMKDIYTENGWDIDKLGREDLDEIGRILTLNTEREGIEKALSEMGVAPERIDALVAFRKKNGSLFSKWHSFSLKLMNELIPEMYSRSKNQMQLLTEMGKFKSKLETFKDKKYIPEDILLAGIYNPVVVRSARISIRILNALLKKYGNPEELIIEMPREKNSDEQKQRIKEEQRKNEKELKEVEAKVADYGYHITDQDYYHHKGLVLKLKLWNEQGGKCLYSGEAIDPRDIINSPNMFEVDHIIPISISLDDSRTNKVLVYHTENQEKGNRTPYGYLNNKAGNWNYDKLCAYIKDLKDMPDKKKKNLKYTDDITKVEVVKGFISRNLNDTRYASRLVLNTLQSYFKAHEADTKVKVIRGSFTHQMRKRLDIKKDRDESYAHHAVDAMLMCFSQMGYEAYRNMQEKLIDFETGEILDEKVWEKGIDADTYEELMYQGRIYSMKIEISRAEKEVKYWHKVDRKPNRGLCNQTIYGTREYDGKTMQVSKIDIYNIKDVETLRKLINGKNEEKFLMYQNDRRTWDDMMVLLNQYSDSKDPFGDYAKETGDYFRKYAKHHDGPKICKLKYLKTVNSYIDISHKYGFAKGSHKVILGSLDPFRMDVYYIEAERKYIFVGVKYASLKFKGNSIVIDKDLYLNELIREKVLFASASSLNDLEKSGAKFLYSFYKNDLIEYEKNGETYRERFRSRVKGERKNYIETKPIAMDNFPGKAQNQFSLATAQKVRKLNTDILGCVYYSKEEELSLVVDRKALKG